MRRESGWRIGGGTVLVLLLGAVFVALATHPGQYQWDLQTYYYGAKAFEEGKNPYDRDVLSAIAGSPVRFRYVYPPHTLPVLAVLTQLSLREASLLWLGLKGVLICLLFWVWGRMLPALGEPGYLVLAVLAFNGAILADVIAGNISLVEQAFLWSGFLMLRKNLTASALLIAAASFFKVSYALFLVLPFLVPGERRGRAVAIGAFFVVAPLAISVLMTPGLFRTFLDTAGVVVDPLERGDNNPCLFAFLLTLADVVREGTGIVIPAGAMTGFFIVHGILVAVLSWRCVRVMRRPDSPHPFTAPVFLLTLLYPLLVPRFKDYAYILLVPAALSMVTQETAGRGARWLLAFILVVPTFTLFSALLPLTEYYLFFAGYALFWWFIRGECSDPAPAQG